jgi:hypothetical protein
VPHILAEAGTTATHLKAALTFCRLGITMDRKPITGQFANSEQMLTTELTGIEIHRARLVVCGNAQDADDAELLLRALGLLDG